MSHSVTHLHTHTHTHTHTRDVCVCVRVVDNINVLSLPYSWVWCKQTAILGGVGSECDGRLLGHHLSLFSVCVCVCVCGGGGVGGVMCRRVGELGRAAWGESVEIWVVGVTSKKKCTIVLLGSLLSPQRDDVTFTCSLLVRL